MTGTLYFLMSGRIASSRSSSPVTELTSGRPTATSSPAFSAAGTEESIEIGQVDQALHDLDRLDEQRRLGRVRIDRGHAGIHVEHQRARRDLRQRVALHRVEIARDHLGRELLAAGRVDALADHAERLVEADHHFPRGRSQNRPRHVAAFSNRIKSSLYRYVRSFKGRAPFP